MLSKWAHWIAPEIAASQQVDVVDGYAEKLF